MKTKVLKGAAKGMKKLFIGCLFLTALILGGCQAKEKEAKSNSSLKIITTFYPMYDFTKNIVGKTGDVSLLIPAGSEPHDYEPSPKDMANIHDADAFVYNSQALETWVHKGKESFGQKVKVIEAAKDIPLMETTENQTDPHVWLSPELAMEEVKTITKSLSQAFPKHQKTFEKNSQAYLEKLAKLNETFKEKLAPFKGRTFITQHTAFSYLAKAYDLKQLGMLGVSEEEEPSPKRLIALKKEAEEKGITTLFYEEEGSKKLMETLQRETGLRLDTLNTIESISEKKQEQGQDYLSLMEENLKNLEKSFQK